MVLINSEGLDDALETIFCEVLRKVKTQQTGDDHEPTELLLGVEANDGSGMTDERMPLAIFYDPKDGPEGTIEIRALHTGTKMTLHRKHIPLLISGLSNVEPNSD